MARVRTLKELKKEKNSLHDETDCTFTTFVADDGTKILQLDTYGSQHRKLAGKVSQSLQFDEQAARHLRELIERTFKG